MSQHLRCSMSEGEGSKRGVKKPSGFLEKERSTRTSIIRRARAARHCPRPVNRMVPVSFAADDDLVDSSPLAPNESPITKERIEYLKSKPYKDTTINVMVLRSAVGDCVEYHAPRWEEETGAHVNITKVPIDTLHQQIFADLQRAGRIRRLSDRCMVLWRFFHL